MFDISQTRINWTNTLFLAFAHLVALGGIAYSIWGPLSGWSVLLGLVWFILCGLSITGGYHRLFAHKAYRAAAPVRLFYLLFGAASIQNSALEWSADHRRHHTHTDDDDDPYSVEHGFWWAHVGWVLRNKPKAEVMVHDLEKDPLVRWQHRYYVPLAILMSAVLPAALGLLWGDPLGALFWAGFLRLVFQWHATFAINSFTHKFGSRPYDRESSARDSWWTALLTFGEGYHNFHHRFPLDYRNGLRWWQFDPTKWFVWSLSWMGQTWDLKRTSRDRIGAARAWASEVRAAQRLGITLAELKERMEVAQRLGITLAELKERMDAAGRQVASGRS
jgi:stearoyl-CoA desaturase (delta-9 desaturase)